MNQQHYDTAVIGGGLAGLTAAAFLAKAGKNVIVLEKAKQIGGRSKTQARSQYLFNLGPHALYIGGGGSQILEELGVAWTGSSPSAEGKAVYQGKVDELFFTPKGVLRGKLFSLREKATLSAIFARTMHTDPESLADLPIGEWINQQTKSPVLRLALQAVVRLSTYANAPELFSTAVFLGQMQLKERVRYLDGGWQTIVAGLQERAELAGADIMTGARVTAVEDNPENVLIHLTDGELVQADNVIIAADPKTASQLLPENGQLKQWADTAVPVRAASLDIALRELPNPEADYAIGIDEPTYLSDHTRAAQLGPEGGHVIHVAKYLPVEATDADQDKAELEAMLDLLQPGWRAALIEQRFLPNMVVNNWLPTAREGGLNGRPGYAIPNSQHLYLAGDWVGPQGWLADGAFISGKKAAELIMAQPEREPVLQSP